VSSTFVVTTRAEPSSGGSGGGDRGGGGGGRTSGRDMLLMILLAVAAASRRGFSGENALRYRACTSPQQVFLNDSSNQAKMASLYARRTHCGVQSFATDQFSE